MPTKPLHIVNLNHQTFPWPFDKLSPRQMECALLMLEGLSGKEIGALMGGLSVKTVDAHRRDVFHRVGVESRVHLAYLAVATGLIEIPRVTREGVADDQAASNNQIADVLAYMLEERNGTVAHEPVMVVTDLELELLRAERTPIEEVQSALRDDTTEQDGVDLFETRYAPLDDEDTMSWLDDVA